MTKRLLSDHLDTPVGRFLFVVDEQERLRLAGFAEGHARVERQLRAHSTKGEYALVPASNPGGLTNVLRAYFEGDLAAIDRVVVETGGTPFQRAVWAALRGIPCGETWSYGQLARRIGRPTAVRAVGMANGANPVGIVVPCHRVVGSDGTLTGYGGGIERKRWLLAHEAVTRSLPFENRVPR